MSFSFEASKTFIPTILPSASELELLKKELSNLSGASRFSPLSAVDIRPNIKLTGVPRRVGETR